MGAPASVQHTCMCRLLISFKASDGQQIPAIPVQAKHACRAQQQSAQEAGTLMSTFLRQTRSSLEWRQGIHCHHPWRDT